MTRGSTRISPCAPSARQADGRTNSVPRWKSSSLARSGFPLARTSSFIAAPAHLSAKSQAEVGEKSCAARPSVLPCVRAGTFPPPTPAKGYRGQTPIANWGTGELCLLGSTPWHLEGQYEQDQPNDPGFDSDKQRACAAGICPDDATSASLHALARQALC